MTTYFRPTPNFDLKSAAMTTFGSGGIIVSPLYDKSAWTFDGTSFSQSGVSGLAGPGASGFFQASTDNASGAYLLQNDGSLVRVTSGSVLSSFTLPAHKTWRGAAYSLAQSGVYAVDSAGDLYTPSGTGMVAVGTGFGSVLALFLAASGSALFTLLPVLNSVGTFTLSASAAGASGVIAITGMDAPTCLTVSSTGIGVGGYTNVVLASGFNTISISPNSTAFIGATSGTSTLSAWGNVTGSWSITNAVTGLNGIGYSAWVSTGLRVLATGLSTDRLYAFNYNLGLLTQTQATALSNPRGVAITPGGDNALVCQASPTNTLTAFTSSGGTWTASGSTLALTNPQVIVPISASGMVIGYASGLALATLSSSGIWSIAATGGVPGSFLPNSIYASGSSVYVAGTNGVSGFFAIATSGLTITGSGTWVGNASGIAAVNNQILIGDSSGPVIRVWGSINGVYSQNTTVTAPAGVRCIAVNGLIYQTQDIFAAGTAQTYQYKFNAPFVLQRAQNGAFSIYTGSWHAVALPTGQIPQCATWNASGNVDIYTSLNTLYTITSGATVVGSSGITQSANQPATTPIGISALAWQGAHLYGSTSVNDSLVQIK